MNLNKRLIAVIDGELHINTAGILLLSAEAVHGTIPAAADAIERAKRTIDELLGAARAGGFTKTEILETMIAKERQSDRVVDMAMEAMSCIGGAAELAAVLARAGFDPEAT